MKKILSKSLHYRYYFILIFIFLITLIINTHAQLETAGFSNGIKYSSNAMNAIFNVIESYNGTEIAQNDKKKTLYNTVKRTDGDSNSVRNSINIRESAERDKFIICLKLEDYNQNIQIDIYNMLGKKVIDRLYSGPAVKPQNQDDCPGKTDKNYQIDKARLSNGFYLVVVHGDKFRLVDKIIVSK